MNEASIEQEAIKILKERSEGTVGQPFGLRVGQIAQRIDGVTWSKLWQVIKDIPEVSRYETNNTHRYFWRGDGE